jgi:hypothetical protein
MAEAPPQQQPELADAYSLASVKQKNQEDDTSKSSRSTPGTPPNPSGRAKVYSAVATTTSILASSSAQHSGNPYSQNTTEQEDTKGEDKSPLASKKERDF